MTTPESFYLPDGDRFVATAHTRGPWDPGLQHAGPPIALVGTLLELRHPRADAVITRVTAEIFRPIPIAALSVETEVARPGKRVELLEASVSAGAEPVLRARAWRIRTSDAVPEVPPAAPPVPPPSAGHEKPFFPTGQSVGWHTAMEIRFVHGAFTEAGPATAWMRMRHPILPGVAPSPLARVLIAADAGNGVSSALDYARWMFINTDLGVYLHRHPIGEWVGLDSRTTIGAGIGLAETTLHDERGPIGKGLQSLFVGAQGA